MNANKAIPILEAMERGYITQENKEALSFAINAIKQLPSDPIEDENELVRKHFDLEEVLEFTKEHRVEVSGGSIAINGIMQQSKLTPLWALTNGIINFKKNNK